TSVAGSTSGAIRVLRAGERRGTHHLPNHTERSLDALPRRLVAHHRPKRGGASREVNAFSPQPIHEFMRLDAGAGHIEKHDIALNALEIHSHSGNLCQPFGQVARIDVILRQPINVLLEGHKPRRRKYTSLSHAAANHLAVLSGTLNVVSVATEERADRG